MLDRQRRRLLFRAGQAGAGLASVVACTTSPVDAIVQADSTGGDPGASGGLGRGGFGTGGPGSSAGGAPAGGPSCEAGAGGDLGEGTYQLISHPTEQCLSVGAAISVVGNPAFEVNLTEDCTPDTTRTWQLVGPDLTGRFQVRSAQVDFNLDIELASAVDGTRAILYEPHTLNNQRFFFRPIDDQLYSIAPGHEPTSCLTAAGTEAQIFPCAGDDENQVWEVPELGCP